MCVTAALRGREAGGTLAGGQLHGGGYASVDASGELQQTKIKFHPHYYSTTILRNVLTPSTTADNNVCLFVQALLSDQSVCTYLAPLQAPDPQAGNTACTE